MRYVLPAVILAGFVLPLASSGASAADLDYAPPAPPPPPVVEEHTTVYEYPPPVVYAAPVVRVYPRPFVGLYPRPVFYPRRPFYARPFGPGPYGAYAYRRPLPPPGYAPY